MFRKVLYYIPANTVDFPHDSTLNRISVIVRGTYDFPLGIPMTIAGNNVTIGGYTMAAGDCKNGDGVYVEMDFERYSMATVPVEQGAIYALL